METLRKYIRQELSSILNEGSTEAAKPFLRYPSIGIAVHKMINTSSQNITGWSFRNNKNKLISRLYILHDENGNSIDVDMVHASQTRKWKDTLENASRFFDQTEDGNINYDKPDLKSVAQYLYLKNKKSKTKFIKEVPLTEDSEILYPSIGMEVKIPGLEGWVAIRSRHESWLIFKGNPDKNRNYVGGISDKGSLWIKTGNTGAKKEFNSELANNPIQTARYIWLMLQKPTKKLKEVSEIKKNNNVSNKDIVSFLSDKKFTNPKSKMFLFHGTKVQPENFVLKDDYNGEDSNTWSGDLPEGYLFLTTDITEATAYGRYIIPCELKRYDHIFFKVNSDNPSQVFDDDYGISLNKQTEFGFWEKFENSMKSVLIMKGNKKYTIITNIDNVIPRIDLSKEFYSVGKTNSPSTGEGLNEDNSEIDYKGFTLGKKMGDIINLKGTKYFAKLRMRGRKIKGGRAKEDGNNPVWEIFFKTYDPNSNWFRGNQWVGDLFDNGDLQYNSGPRHEYSSGWEKEINLGTNDVMHALRMIYLNRLKPSSETLSEEDNIGLAIGPNSTIYIDNTNWRAEDTSNTNKGKYKYTIYDEFGTRVGIIGQYGLLYRDKGNDVMESDHTFKIDIDDEESIQNAIRYVYLMSRKSKFS